MREGKPGISEKKVGISHKSHLAALAQGHLTCSPVEKALPVTRQCAAAKWLPFSADCRFQHISTQQPAALIEGKHRVQACSPFRQTIAFLLKSIRWQKATAKQNYRRFPPARQLQLLQASLSFTHSLLDLNSKKPQNMQELFSS